MNAPLYSFEALNTLALMDTGHFVYLDNWSIGAVTSIVSQALPLYLWQNNQYPLTQVQIDDLQNKMATALGQLMKPMLGLIIATCSVNIPDGTLLCDGATYARVDYPNLYDAIDPSLHIDADMFTVPDLRERFILGSGPTHAPLSTGGSFEHVQSLSELAAHSHNSPPHAHTEVTATPVLVTVGLELPTAAAIPGAGFTGSTSVSIDSTGSSEAMDITPPYYALKYVVVAL